MQDFAALSKQIDRCVEEADYEAAIELIKRLESRATNDPTGHAIWIVHNQYGRVYQRRNEFGSSLEAHNRALDIAAEINDLRCRASSLHNIGLVYQYTGSYDVSLEYFNKSYVLKVQIGDDRLLTTTLHEMGNTLSKLGRHEAAVPLFKEALAIKERLGTAWSTASTMMSIGICFQHMNKLDESLEYHFSALALKEGHPNILSYAYSLQNIAEVYRMQEQFEKAIEFALRGLEIKRKQNNRLDIGTSLLLLTEAHSCLGNGTDALNYANELAAVADTMGMQHTTTMSCRALSLAYEALGDPAAALQWHKRFHESLMKERHDESIRRVELLMVVHEFDKTKHRAELERLRAEALERELALKNKELTTLALTLAQKNEALTRLKYDIEKAYQEGNAASRISGIRREVAATLSGDTSWHVFEQQFQSVHNDFLQRISSRYPSLTAIELRVCSLLKLQLSTKEIAHLLCIEPKSVEVYRYRIRKKMNVDSSANLASFFSAL